MLPKDDIEELLRIYLSQLIMQGRILNMETKPHIEYSMKDVRQELGINTDLLSSDYNAERIGTKKDLSQIIAESGGIRGMPVDTEHKMKKTSHYNPNTGRYPLTITGNKDRGASRLGASRSNGLYNSPYMATNSPVYLNSIPRVIGNRSSASRIGYSGGKGYSIGKTGYSGGKACSYGK